MLCGIISFGNEKALKYPKFLFCGSFNPLHCGHVSIVDYIYNKSGVPVDFEISHNNVEKPSITIEDMRKRYEQMRTQYRPSFGKLYMTDDARYLEKARILPDVTFVCGFDTMKALCDGCYYKEEKFDEVIKEFNDLGIKWLVFPRQKDDGVVSCTDDFRNFPKALSRNIRVIEDFNPVNISSRQLRK